MICPACAVDREFADGRCTTCGGAEPAPAAPAIRCPKCRSGVEAGEKFCARCGAKIPTRADRIRAAHRSRERQETQLDVNRGRRWMLIMAVLTLFGAVFSYFSGMSQVEKRIREEEVLMAGMTPVERDATVKEETGLSWEEFNAQRRSLISFEAVMLGALGSIFLGLWWWAQKNAFAASLIALLLFVSTMLVRALLNPATLLSGIIFKVFIVIGLFSAVSAGYRQRTLQRRRAA